MQLSDLDYDLPDELIAQHPAERREASRMLIVDRSTKSFQDDAFRSFPRLLRAGDVLVLNNTRVFPARLLGRTDTGANVEIFLVKNLSARSWRALARPAKRLKRGKRIAFGSELVGLVSACEGGGFVEIGFEFEGDFYELLERTGSTPLPPYIKREDANAGAEDAERYQTIFAKNRGAIAAPTAGLHFTTEILEEIEAAGIEIAEITLHVGYGTFEPVRADDLTEHAVLPEQYEIGDSTAELLNSARQDKRRIVAVGTTTTRALESAIAGNGRFSSGEAVAELTITPGYRFQTIGALLTNFHLPKSSLLILVSTFAGHELIMSAYKHAVDRRYSFYSYGDCMFIL